MFAQVDRLLSRGQRALQAQQFQVAIECLEQAVQVDPSQPHPHMYLGMAQAGFGHLDQAESELSTAATLAPDNFVFHMQLGILQLDRGDATRALDYFQRAKSLSPENALVAGYIALASFDLGQSTPLLLGDHVSSPNTSFRARTIIRIEQKRHHLVGSRACLRALLSPEELLPAGRSTLDRLMAWRPDRQIRRLSRLLLECRFEDAIQFVHDRPHLLALAAGPALLGLARAGAIDSLIRVVTSLNSTPGLDQTAKEDRRSVLARLAQIQMDSNDTVGAYATLRTWRDSFEGSDRSHQDKLELATIFVTMAHVEVEQGRYREAVDLCAQARQEDAPPQMDAVEAMAWLGLGDTRTARQRLESFLDARLFPVRTYIQTLGFSSP